MSNDTLFAKLVQNNARATQQMLASAKSVEDTTPVDDSKNYIGAVEKWATRARQTVDITVQRFEHRHGKGEQRIVAKVACSATPSCVCAQKRDSESVEQCKQRAARNFLQMYHGAPFVARR